MIEKIEVAERVCIYKLELSECIGRPPRLKAWPLRNLVVELGLPTVGGLQM
jgi:hypothetical protein